MALVIAIQGAQPVEMNANAPEPAPFPTMTAMKVMVVIISTPQVPVTADIHPTRAGPTPQDAQAIQMSTNASSSAPEPSRSSIVAVTPPQVPVGTHATPMALVVAIQGAQPVQVHANAPEPAPSPSVAAVQVMVVIIATPQVPVAADLHPARAGPSPQDAQAV